MAVIYIDGNEHELPKMTLKVKEAFNAALDKRKGEREQATALFKLMKDILPDDYVCKRVGGKAVDSVDVVELAILAEEVWDAYQAPIAEARNERQRAQIAEWQPILDDMRGILEAVERGQKAQGRNAFKAAL